MIHDDALLLVLRILRDHDGEWGWYQLERDFSNTSVDVMPTLDALVQQGFVSANGDAQLAATRYTLTEKGHAKLRRE